MWLFILLIVFYLFTSISLYFLFPKAKETAWKGLVPGVNFGYWAKLVGRSSHHAWWLLFPIVNIFIFAALAIDLARSFGRHSFLDGVLAVIVTPFYYLYLAFNKKVTYEGPVLTQEKEYYHKITQAKTQNQTKTLKTLLEKNPYKRSAPREWVESIIFAVFAAAFIRMFLIEAYVIPTPSMEGSLLVGDFLFVSKAHYGIRTPMTVAMIPLLHNQIPILKSESYLKKPSLPYYRLPALEKIKRNSPIVFNWPVGDSVYVTNERSWTAQQAQAPFVKSQVQNANLRVRPIDKKDHYIKRCIALPGDSLEIRDKQVYINGEMAPNPSKLQYLYIVQTTGTTLNPKMLEDMGVDVSQGSLEQGYFFLNNEQVEKLKGMTGVNVIPYPRNTNDGLFPQDTARYGSWSQDNYGPIWIPKAGATISLNLDNLSLYFRLITVYENNDLEVKEGRIYLNGQETTTYTFKQDYYWAMGDNRHNSEDSRYWGFVPHDHIVGKPLFIWFSTKKGNIGNGINWSRLFTSANKM